MKTVTVRVVLALTASGATAQNGAGAAATGPTMASAGTDSLAVARKYTVWFYTGQADSLRAHQSADGELAGFGFNPRSQAPAVDP